jgi:hypothetical protein
MRSSLCPRTSSSSALRAASGFTVVTSISSRWDACKSIVRLSLGTSITSIICSPSSLSSLGLGFFSTPAKDHSRLSAGGLNRVQFSPKSIMVAYSLPGEGHGYEALHLSHHSWFSNLVILVRSAWLSRMTIPTICFKSAMSLSSRSRFLDVLADSWRASAAVF